MNTSSIFQEVKFLFGAFVVLAIMFLSGCSSMTYDKDANFDSKGLPNHKYLVGGGLDIDWTVPESGTVYLVEEKTAKIVMMESLAPGEVFEFNPDIDDQEGTKAIFGEEISKLKFSLYFIPRAKLNTKD